jgi:hypothetical protein
LGFSWAGLECLGFKTELDCDIWVLPFVFSFITARILGDNLRQGIIRGDFYYFTFDLTNYFEKFTSEQYELVKVSSKTKGKNKVKFNTYMDRTYSRVLKNK